MNSTTTVNFSALDYRGIDSLSSYALPLTPFIFIPDTSDLEIVPDNTHRVVWDFGDGTLSKSFSASKSYEFPGMYDVNMIIYDCDNNAQISTQTKTITIYDYIPFTFNIQAMGYLITEEGVYIIDENGDKILSTMNELSGINIPFGKIEGVFDITASYPVYQPPSSIFYSVSGSLSQNYWDIKDNKYSHLEKFYALYNTTYNYALSSDQYIEIDRVTPTVSDVYARIVNNSIELCQSSDENAVVVGKSGSSSVYIKDDIIKNNVDWYFFFDKTNNVIPFYTGNTNHLNNLGIKMTLNVVDNEPSRLSITSNGLDGEGFTIDSFNINPIKYYNTSIPFVIKFKDIDNFSLKNFPLLELGQFTIQISGINNIQLTDEDGNYLLGEDGKSLYNDGGEYILNTPQLLTDFQLTDDNGNYIITEDGRFINVSFYDYNLNNSDYVLSSLNYTLSSYDIDSCFRGFVKFPNLTAVDVLQNLKITISGEFTSNDSNVYTLSGESNYFNVYPDGYFDLYKKNEDFNPEQTLMDLRFQETLLDKDVLFRDFLGGALGNENSDHDGIGIKIYEKIANFVSNTQDIDVCEEESINSLGDFMGYNKVNQENYTYPDKIKRIINLASIDTSKLIGTTNKFKENFDTKGRTSKDEYGRNIGDKIDTRTYIVSAGTDIIALEKFSNTYSLLNTYQPVSAVNSYQYPLSSYTSDFGWPLVLPTDFTFDSIEKYYLFFNYNNQFSRESIGGVVDFNNSKTTLDLGVTYNELYENYGIVDNLFSNTLYKSLSLI